MESKSKRLAAALGALIYALIGVYLIVTWARTATVPLRDLYGPGIGAVSIDISGFLVGLLPVVGSIFVSRELAAWAHRSSRGTRMMHRVHKGMIVLVIAVTLTVPLVLAAMAGSLPFLGMAVAGMTLGLQLMTTAALLGLYAVHRSSSAFTAEH